MLYLYCMPTSCPAKSHKHPKGPPWGHIHRRNEPCPFNDDDVVLATAQFMSCCWLYGQYGARELKALGEDRLAKAMYADMTCKGAIAFAGKLRAAARKLERRYMGKPEWPDGAEWTIRRINPASRRPETIREVTRFDEALDMIRRTARWYYRVGRRGFGVHPHRSHVRGC